MEREDLLQALLVDKGRGDIGIEGTDLEQEEQGKDEEHHSLGGLVRQGPGDLRLLWH